MEKELFNFLSRHIDLSDEEKQMFTEMDLFKSYKKGYYLLKEGQIAKTFFFVIKGCVRTFYSKDGEEKTTAFYLEEDSIMPESLETKEPSKYTIKCEEDCTLLIASPEMEASVFIKYPKFESLCRVLSEKQNAKIQARYDEFVTSSPEERYLNLINTRPQLLQRIPQYLIASYLT
ncbi:MAG: Crp/Fnr family transcriptional regulator [Bacteroidetes bacterium]|nr:Crp/Fnr family transcriptional regulator [Bacteroidota bacterium]